MRLPNLTILFFLFFTYSFAGNCQAPWFNSMPLYYNPSYAGGKGDLNINNSNRMSVGIQNSTSIRMTNDLSIDHFIPKLKSGIGLLVSSTNGTRGVTNGSKVVNNDVKENLNYIEAAFIIAPKISFSGKHTLSPSFQIGYLNLKNTMIVPSLMQEEFDTPLKYQSLRFTAGLLYNNAKLQVGISSILSERVIHVNKYHKNVNTYMHVGYNFSKSEDAKFSFTPIILISMTNYNRERNGSFDKERENFRYINVESINPDQTNLYINVMLNFRYKKFISGIDSQLKFMTGYQSDRLRLMLVIGVYSKLVTEIQPQLAFRYTFGKDHSNRVY